ncbi:hypothetical protein FV139_15870 [Parahaliea maris]|uniref:General secretion pathway protein GspM n=1 Tax=Parahaliea maris TaxID=2716870 RepID=A0A5C8ZTU2_9GAMM|nr:type II secretion system protein GspM [Parahaliea maris]TXS91219.1 hypothetical protein FV139_15870 [Parahaliea maris]
MKNLSPGVQRLVAIALLAVLLLVFVQYVAMPLWTYYASRAADFVFQRRQAHRFEYLLAHEEAIDVASQRLALENDGGELFLPGSKPAIASANLREFVTDAVERSGAQLVSTQEYEAGAVPSVTAIGLQVNVNGEIRHLVDLLHDIENSRPVVLIDQLNIVSSSPIKGAVQTRSPGTVGQEHFSLGIRINLVAYLLGESSDET